MKEKVLVTGASGFIGSHLVESCLDKGFDVKAFVHYNSNNSWGWLDHSCAKEEIEVIAGDIRDYDSVSSAMKGVTGVFHLAALIGIPYSYVSPLAYVRTNIEGTYNVLQAARGLGVNNLIVTSTSETYGTAQSVPINENHPLVGQSPYSASKIAADHLAISYYKSFDLPVKIARPFNTYGPRQSARAINPTIISQIICGAKEIELGNLSPTRDLTYVKDTCSGFLEIYRAESLYGKVTNIGMNREISIGDLAEKIIELMGVNVVVSHDYKRLRPDKSEVDQLRCDNAQLVSNTSWKPEYDLTSGLRETIEWMEKNKEYYRANEYNV